MRKPGKIGVSATLCAVMMSGLVTAQMQRGGDRPGGPQAGMRGRVMNNPLERSGFLLRILKDSELLKESGIRAEQAEKLNSDLVKLEEKDIELQAQMRKAALEQAELLADASPDKDALMEAVEKVGTARTEMAKLSVERVLAVRATLSEEQIQTLMEKTRERFMSRRNEREREEDGRTPREGRPKRPENRR